MIVNTASQSYDKFPTQSASPGVFSAIASEYSEFSEHSEGSEGYAHSHQAPGDSGGVGQ